MSSWFVNVVVPFFFSLQAVICCFVIVNILCGNNTRLVSSSVSRSLFFWRNRRWRYLSSRGRFSPQEQTKTWQDAWRLTVYLYYIQRGDQKNGLITIMKAVNTRSSAFGTLFLIPSHNLCNISNNRRSSVHQRRTVLSRFAEIQIRFVHLNVNLTIINWTTTT